MRSKEKKLVISFYTTADAMAMEKACRECNAPGRLIPVPRNISAGCGMAWCTDLQYRDEILKVLKEKNIYHEAVYECMLRA